MRRRWNPVKAVGRWIRVVDVDEVREDLSLLSLLEGKDGRLRGSGGSDAEDQEDEQASVGRHSCCVLLRKANRRIQNEGRL